jgi:hypothetical protein
LPKYAFYLIFIPQEFYSLIHVQGAPGCDSPLKRGLGGFKKTQKKDPPSQESLLYNQ